MRQRLLAVVMTAAFVAGLVLVVPVAGAQEVPDTNLDLTIEPTEGPPGTVVDTFVPPEQALEVCLDPDVALDELIAALEDLADESEATIGDLEGLIALDPLDPQVPELEALIAQLEGVVDLLNGLIASLPAIGGIAVFYVLAFADIVTQEPVGPTSMWDPVTGEGQITAPEAPFGLYALAALCLGLDLTVDLDDVTETLEGMDPSDPEAMAEAIVMLFVDPDNPIGLGFELYCLGDAAFCAELLGPGNGVPATPVTGDPRFTG